MIKEFVPHQIALDMKSIGFDEPCLAYFEKDGLTYGMLNEIGKKRYLIAPTFSQAINFLYICSNKQINIELKGSDTYEERIRKIEQGCKDLWNLQNNKSNQ
jgi:hypothetical protein